MATSSKIVSRLSCRLNSLAFFKLNKNTLSPQLTSLTSSSPTRRLSRLPVELSCAVRSLLPLHSATASSRLVSSLSLESESWALVPQGISMPL